MNERSWKSRHTTDFSLADRLRISARNATVTARRHTEANRSIKLSGLGFKLFPVNGDLERVGMQILYCRSPANITDAITMQAVTVRSRNE